jgi:hypothetical protein
MLVRFRANPRRVRIGVRRDGEGWYVRIYGGALVVTRWAKSPGKALVLALRAAEGVDMPGIDLGMQWAYDHPQRPE